MLTSYFAITPHTRPGAISISRFPPKCGYVEYRALAPGDWFKSVGADEYVERYTAGLARLDPEMVWTVLNHLARSHATALGFTYAVAEQTQPVLLCYETPKDFCHRRLAADWLMRSLGVSIPEARLNKATGEMNIVAAYGEESPASRVVQLQLF